MSTYKLLSTPLGDTPRIVDYLISNLRKTPDTLYRRLHGIFPNLPPEALDKLLVKDFKIEGDVILVEVNDGKDNN